jgi:hypothetical protein
MFQITQQYIDGQARHAVVGEVGHQLVTVLATSEMQAREIARCLNEAASVEIEELTEIVSAENLHETMEDLLARRPDGYQGGLGPRDLRACGLKTPADEMVDFDWRR